MIITQEAFYREFVQICKRSLTHSTCKLAIFVSCFDIDSICSSRMISEYLKRQFIVFQLIPVIGYLDMKEKYLKLDSDISNVIFIGCGATADLEGFLEIDLNEFLDPTMGFDEAQNLIDAGKLDEVKLTRKIYVIDGHRPWNLDNLYGSPMICCLDDNSTKELNDERDAFYYLINIDEDAPENEDVSEEEQEEEEVEELATDNDEDDLDLDLEESLDRKRRLAEPKESKKKRQKRLISEYQELLESYYQQGSTISIPSSHQMYDLLATIGEMNIDYLWLAIVGSRSLRDVYKRVYDMTYPGLKNEVQRLTADENSYSFRSNNNENLTGNGKSLMSYNVSRKADNTSLQTCKEYNLFLLQHWTLYDAFFYSGYVNSKCHLYTNEGSRLLKTMFARMGIPLIQANQNWHYLDLELKKKLDTLIERETVKFKLNEIIIDGFKRNYGFHGSITSGDYVEAVQALLEFGISEDKMAKLAEKAKKKKVRSGTDGDDGNGIGGNNADNDDNDGDGDESANNEENKDKLRNDQYLQSFWRAYDALNNYEEIIKGMDVAKYQQQFIFEKGSEIIQKGMIKTQSKFKVVILNESFTSNSSITRSNRNDSTFNRSVSSMKDDRVVDITSFGNGAQMFQNPLILTKLGNWILNIQAELEEGLLPLLIGAYNSDTQTYLICGLPSRTTFDDEDDSDDDDDDSDEDDDDDDDDDDNEVEEGGENYDDEGNPIKKKKNKKRSKRHKKKENKASEQKVILNAFSVLFEKVTQEISIQARMDSFQSAIIELRKEDLTKFLDGLTRYSQYML